MRTAAAAIALAAPVLACVTAPPAGNPRWPSSDPPAFTAAFDASVRGAQGRMRLRGVLAVAGGGRLRAEITGASVAAPMIVVASPGGILAILISQRIYHRGGPGAPILEEIAGLAVRPEAIAELLTGERAVPPAPCTGSLGRWAPFPGDRRVPARLRLRCAGADLDLRLSAVRPLEPEAGHDPFELIEPEGGYERVELRDLARALRGDPSGSR